MSSPGESSGRGPGATAFYWLLVALYMGVIFFVSAQAPVDGLDVLGETGLDKVVHAVEFGILAFLMLSALSASGIRKLPVLFIIAGLASTLYAVSDEIHQLHVPGRTSTIGDVIADVVGITIVIILWPKVQALLQKRKKTA